MSGDESATSSVEFDDTVPSVINSHNKNNNRLVNGEPMQCTPSPTDGPRLEIVEQPKSRGFRFRYACEGKSHGGLQGMNSTKNKKTSPSVRIHNYVGPVKIVVKLVTDELSPRPHAHQLIGKDCDPDGTCVKEIKAEMIHSEITFPNISILHVTKKKVNEILTSRIMDDMKVSKMKEDTLATLDINNIQLTEADKKKAQIQAKEQSKSMQLNVVRLCFQAYLKDTNGHFTNILQSVVSDPIYDCKSPGAAALKICRMDRHSGCCVGSDEVFLLCDKVQKEDIAVRFFEEDDEGVIWEANGSFGPADVHRQYAIVFRTPPYKNQDIDRPVQVLVQLTRQGDHEASEPIKFTYTPQQKDQDELMRKRQKTLPDIFNMNGTSAIPNTTFIPANNLAFIPAVPVHSNGAGIQAFQIGQFGDLQANHVQMSQHPGAVLAQVPVLPVQKNVMPVSVIPPSDIQLQARPIQMKPKGMSASSPLDDIKENGHLPSSKSNGLFSNGHVELKNALLQNSVNRKHLMDGDIETDSCPFQEDDDIDDVDACISRSGWTAEIQPSISGKIDSGYSQSITSVSLHQQTEVKDDECEVLRAAGGSSSTKAMYGTLLTRGQHPMPEPLAKPQTYTTTITATSAERGSMFTTATITPASNSIFNQEPIKIVPVSTKTEYTTTGVQTDEVTIVDRESKGQEVVKLRVDTSAKAEAGGELTPDCMEELAWKVAENTALALQEFAKSGNIAYLLVIQRHLVAVQDENGDNAIHMAVIHRHIEPLRNLLLAACSLSNNIAVNDYNRLQQTPLHLAVITNQPQVIELLIKNNASMSVIDRNGNTAAHLAALHAYDRCLESLLTVTLATFGKKALLAALNQLNYEGFSALHLAVRQGSLSCVKHLVLAEAEVNLADGKSGYTALHHATESENLGIVGYLLLEASADPNIPAYNSNTALHIAVGRDLLGVAALLVASGADTDVENSEVISSESEGDENPKPKTKRSDSEISEIQGITPLDMAEGNPKMMAILKGEPYSSVRPSQPSQGASSNTLYSGLADSGLGINTKDGDLDRLDLVTRMKLSQLLDTSTHGEGWHKLAELTGLSSLIPAFSTLNNPTKAILDNLEILDCKVSKLKSALKSMKRYDAIEVIDEGLALHQQALNEYAEKRKNTMNQPHFVLESKMNNLSV